MIGRAHVAFGREFDAMSSPGNDPQFEEHRFFVGGGLEIGQRRLHGIVAGEVADGTDNSFGLYAGGRVSGRHFAFDLGVTHLKGVRVPVPMLGLALRR